MGYYTGSGVTSGGSDTITIHEHFAFFGAHNIYQNHKTSTTRKSGVSLTTARNEASTSDMQTYEFTWTASGHNCSHWSPNCKGTTKNVSYSQIGNSNLYELTITNDVIKAKLDNGNWVS